MQVDDAEEAAVVDRRHAVPPCRELFITVEAEAGECKYLLQVKQTRIKIILTKAEITSQIQKMKRGWESRLHELQREPVAREQFEEYLLNLKDSIWEKKREMYGSHDHVAMNVAMNVAEETDYGTKLLKMKKKALKRCALQDEAQKRREVKDQVRQDKLEGWMNRAEARREARDEQDRAHREQQKLQDVQKDWLLKLAVVTYAEKLKAMSFKAREWKRMLAQKVQSAELIHKYMIRSLSYKRRQKLYHNIVYARIAFTAYARHARLGVFHAGMPIVRSFLETEGFNREVPSLTGALSRFKGKVIVLQRWWRGVRIKRNAYVQFFLPMWLDLQMLIYRAKAEKLAMEELAQQNPETHTRGSTIRRNSNSGADLKQTQHHTSAAHPADHQVDSNTRRGRRPSQCSTRVHHRVLERQKTIEATQDQLPAYIIKVLLMEYILRMQKTYRQRVKDWEEEVQNDEFKHDLEGFGVADEDEDSDDDDDPHFRKPRAVYVDRDELQAIVKDSVATWNAGGWKELRHSRHRIMKGSLKPWRRYVIDKRNRAAMGLPALDDERPFTPKSTPATSPSNRPRCYSSAGEEMLLTSEAEK
jgi:hypothetical protein